MCYRCVNTKVDMRIIEVIKLYNYSKFKSDQYILLILTTLSYIFIFSIYPIRDADSGVWIPMATNFFGSLDTNIGVHRPLFGFLAFIIASFLKLITPEIIEITFATGINDQLNMVQGSVARAFIGWMILNYIFYVIIVITAYKTALLLLKETRIAFIYAVLVLISTELTNWLTNLAIMVQGVLIVHISIYFLVKYCLSNLVTRKKISIYFGILFGILMLGKAEYQFIIFLTLLMPFYFRKHLHNYILFIIFQSIPLVLWFTYLNIFKSGYRVYEINRDDYNIIDYWISSISNEPITGIIDFFFVLPFQGFISSAPSGLGIIFTISIFLTTGFFLKDEIGKFLLLYIYSTAFFLFVVNFAMARHTFEYGPIAYFGASLTLNSIYLKFVKNRNVLIKSIFYLLVITVLITYFYLNLKRNLAGINPNGSGRPLL
jgi:hypothetical protein